MNRLWRNEFLFYLFCRFAPYYEANFGPTDDWKEEADCQWREWLVDLENGKDPRCSCDWKGVELN